MSLLHLTPDLGAVSVQIGPQSGFKKRSRPKISILYTVCASVPPDGWPAGRQEDLHHQWGPAVPQTHLRGGNHDQPGLLYKALPAAVGRYQGKGVRKHTYTHIDTHLKNTILTGLFSLRIVKIPDNPNSLSFRLCGSAPPHVHAVRKGWWNSNYNNNNDWFKDKLLKTQVQLKGVLFGIWNKCHMVMHALVRALKMQGRQIIQQKNAVTWAANHLLVCSGCLWPPVTQTACSQISSPQCSDFSVVTNKHNAVIRARIFFYLKATRLDIWFSSQ